MLDFLLKSDILKGKEMRRPLEVNASLFSVSFEYANEHGIIAAIYLTWGTAYMLGKNYRKR